MWHQLRNNLRTRRFAAPATLIAIAIAVLVTSQGLAQEVDGEVDLVTPAERSLESLLLEAEQTPLTELTVADISAAMDLVSIARQEREHIERSASLSWRLPGLGHYINGDTGSAIVFASAEVLVVGLTGVLTYLLLPPAVQQSNLNYLQSSRLDIRDRWDEISASQLIPSAAAAISGTLLGLTVRGLAARTARELAIEAIANGTVRFEPEPAGGLSAWR